jgi:glucuronosyltransferase
VEEVARKRFNFDFPPLKELVERTALIFVNTDNAIDFPEPLQPNMIQVGGLQILDSKPLPEVSSTFGWFPICMI